ncbi:hypothetical protein SAY87_002191 [Trapa incisa]|uniref:Uncharacterized protein n=1 Tax=Trapa incisa TaxID=236973 RepID=A0AAN7JVB5_9MYRT|nr:hypothetical protein SAY87_002191 [Trapa incisa]
MLKTLVYPCLSYVFLPSTDHATADPGLPQTHVRLAPLKRRTPTKLGFSRHFPAASDSMPFTKEASNTTAPPLLSLATMRAISGQAGSHSRSFPPAHHQPPPPEAIWSASFSRKYPQI